MTVVTIQAGTGNNFNSSGTTTLTLYNVNHEHIGKSAGFTDTAMPTKDSNQKIVLDYMGSSRTIHIEGTVTTDDMAGIGKHLGDYARDIVGLKGTNTSLIFGNQSVNGGTQRGYIFTPGILNYGTNDTVTINVYVSEASVDWLGGSPDGLTYSIDLTEGSNLKS